MKDRMQVARLIERARDLGLLADDGLPRVIDIHGTGPKHLWVGVPIDIFVDGIKVDRVFYANRETNEVRRFVLHKSYADSFVLSRVIGGEMVIPPSGDEAAYEVLHGRVEFRWREGQGCQE